MICAATDDTKRLNNAKQLRVIESLLGSSHAKVKVVVGHHPIRR
jgi:hypothetical protein